MPWWVKFLWACSRQCKKTTTNNLHMDRQCKKNCTGAFTVLQTVQKKTKKKQQFTYGQTVQKTNTQFTYGQTVQKKTKKHFTYGQTVQKNCTGAFTVLQTVQKKKKKKFTYGQYIFTDCTEDNVQNTHTYTQYTVYYKDTLNYQRHIIHRMGTSTLCTVSIHNVVYT